MNVNEHITDTQTQTQVEITDNICQNVHHITRI